MSRRLLSYVSLAALVAGVASLATGVASLIGNTAEGLAAFDFCLLLIGLSSWIAGVCLSKKLK
jgi:hypothetical protein